MNSQKFQVKFYLEPSAFDPEDVVPVFHRWIREHTLPELIIDVADYTHVFEGPGIALIGDGTDYFLDQSEGRLGLLFSRKRHAPAEDQRVQDGFRRALNACALLEADTGFKHPLRFATNEILVRAPDRLLTPNTEGSFAEFKAQLEPVLSRAYAGAGLTITHVGDAKGPLTVRIKSDQKPSVPALLERLGGAPTA
jgi:hypothetical protein